MYDMLKEQTDLIKELNQLKRMNEQKENEEKKEESKLPGLQLFGF